MKELYSIIDTEVVDKLADMLEQEGVESGEVFRFKVDTVFFVNYLRSSWNKELTEADELDVVKFKEYINNEITFPELLDRRINNVKMALQKLKEIN